MMRALSEYFDELIRTFGTGWNRFWFTPADPFTLGWVRILAGFLACWFVASYTPDLERFFGPEGVLSVPLVTELQSQGDQRAQLGNAYRWSYLDYCTTSQSLRLAHYAGLAVLAAFTLGLGTRLTSCLSVVVFLSYIHRAPMLTAQAEPILAFVLLYLCVGPAGACCSLDRRLGCLMKRTELGAEVPRSISANVAIRLIQVHLTAVFVMMSLAKMFGDVWWNGTAIWWLIDNSPGRLIDLRVLSRSPYLVNAWTHAQVFYELTFVVFVWPRLTRPLVLAAGFDIRPAWAAVTGLFGFAGVLLTGSLAFADPAALRALLGGAASCSESPDGR